MFQIKYKFILIKIPFKGKGVGYFFEMRMSGEKQNKYKNQLKPEE